MLILLIITLLCSIVSIFFFICSKNLKWDSLSASSFECGFQSYFYSRFSFSIHYFLLGLIFLFLDLELCLLLPFFNQNFSNLKIFFLMVSFFFLLTMGLLKEWSKGNLDWKF